METDTTLRALSSVHYYLREGYFGSALPYCEGRSSEQAADSQISVLKGVALALLGKPSEAVKALDPLRGGPCNLGVLNALKYSHQLASNPDKKTLSELETSITTSVRTATDVELLSAAEVLFFSGQAARAKSLLEKQAQAQLKFDQNARNAKLLSLLGWIDLAMGRDQKSTKELFEMAVALNYPDGFVGKSRLCELHHSPTEMRAITKDLTSAHISFFPSHIERARAAMADNNWDAAWDAIQNSSLANETDSCYIALLVAIHSICAAGFKSDSALVELKSTLEGMEKDNHELHFRIAQLLTRCATRNKTILSFAKNLLAKAVQLSPKEEYMLEELRLAMALEDSKETLSVAKDLIQAGLDDPYAVLGMCLGYLMAGKIKDAAEQFEFVHSVHPNVASSSLYIFMAALIARYKDNNFEEYIRKMDDFVTTHQSQVQNNVFGLKYLKEMDIELLLTAGYTLLDYAPVMPTRTPSPALRQAERIFTWIFEKCPGMTTISVILARIQYLHMDYDAAEKTLVYSLEKNATIADAHLLRAQIMVNRGRGTEAEKALNTGLAFNFDVRDSSLYKLVMSKVFRKKNDLDEAIKTLESGLKEPVKKPVAANLLGKREPADAHRISIQLELIDCLQSKKRVVEAEVIMKQAMEEWKGKGEAGQLVLLNADLHLSKGDPDGALDILGKVKPTDSNYQTARVKMAEIYLDVKKDRRSYILSYKELLPLAQTSGQYALIGDAYMNIQEPEKAIDVYEIAQKKNPKDVSLTEKIGEAYVMCHLYTKAVNFYEAMMKQHKSTEMRLRLADLLLKLGQTEKCEAVLTQPLTQDNPVVISAHVQYLQLLSKLHLNQDKRERALSDLEQARELQVKLMQKDSSTSGPIKKDAAKLTCMIAEMNKVNKEYDIALRLYKEANSFDPNNSKVGLAIAECYLLKRDLTQCQDKCMDVLKFDRLSYEAHLMLADVQYLRNESDTALQKYSDVLSKQHSNYHALERFIELCWRTGQSPKAQKKLEEVTASNPRVASEPGFNYCRGLHEWYSGEINAALQAFNRAKKDATWGDKSLCNIIEICLNPDNEVIGAETLEEGGDLNSIDAEREVATKTAEGFLDELRRRGQEQKCVLMENFILVRGGDKNMVNQALQTMLNMIGNDTGIVKNVGAVLGSAQAYLYIKQTQKAKQVLKRVFDHPWTVNEAYYLEKCWLLLAEIYVSQNRPDQVNKLLNSVLTRNQSCWKAYELQGQLKEKESNFLEASSFYQHAWDHNNRRNPSIGYKLAYNYLKCRKVFECLDVCDIVLTKYPSHSKIRKDIQEKETQEKIASTTMETDDRGDILEVASSPPTFSNPTAAFPINRALFIRINTSQGLGEQRIAVLQAPFRGFAVYVRFQCRAKIHSVSEKIILPLL